MKSLRPLSTGLITGDRETSGWFVDEILLDFSQPLVSCPPVLVPLTLTLTGGKFNQQIGCTAAISTVSPPPPTDQEMSEY